ncbi:hypothetical protein JCGZ_00812 [Jatropha curcas]|uniref:Fe2OG dioxygenase domain-containing protein n=2 Tax=Jatropha curcas TaxID=180498 RepID=A0A067L3H1_JATCU|nr:gibberellin 2-beta-dioxygenase 8 isoform X2 [Jatropha curcas]XP_037492488.1 gibberellin 2-beta-dioxygenase 8 isoform X2 [Jatropha curcas]KDP39055.1 hypothetical protein JCGZ_00812 [Jatropha curcas]
MGIDPPFQETYRALWKGFCVRAKEEECKEFELPLIDMSRLRLGDSAERKKYIKAASEWGFFQVVNHGISEEVLQSLRYEQMKVFHQPFNNKSQRNFLNLPSNSYRWGNSYASCLSQFPWSEALHLSPADISRIDGYTNLRSSIEAFAGTAATLAQTLAEILAENLGVKSSFFTENCTSRTSCIRMNRYPSCPFSSEVYGLVPHTDSDILTILYQDQTGGLQLLRDGRWLTVKPNPQSLTINIGDLLQVFSNDVYRSIQHRVVAPQQVERFSLAYFYCPSSDAVIQSYRTPTKYRKFTFREYKQQILKDLQATGNKVGLSRFLF